MEDYCEQDVRVTLKLWRLIESKNYSQMAIDLEHEFAPIINRQERVGVKFNKEAAEVLLQKLQVRKAELEAKLAEYFPPWERVIDPCFIPKANNKRYGYVKGVPFVKKKTIIFNPTSRDHITERLQAIYGWKPKDFNKRDGKPTLNEDILATLDYPPVALIQENLTVNKRLGQIAEGKEAWLNHLTPEGRIHGRVMTNGARTGRCTHSKPNLGQVPATRKPYGTNCRALFLVPPKRKLVGADASGLELRCLGHELYPYDGGAYAEEVVKGDVHWKNLQAIGVCPKGLPRDKSNKNHDKGRDAGKTWTYSRLYGCFPLASGREFTFAWKEFHGRPLKTSKSLFQVGEKSRDLFASAIEGLPELEAAIAQEVYDTKYIQGLDGRLLDPGPKNAWLNTKLQSDGALIMKKALCVLDEKLQSLGLKHSDQSDDFDYEFVLNVHDEWQAEVKEEYAELVAKESELAMTKAGEFFNFRCLVEGESKIGNNWKETH